MDGTRDVLACRFYRFAGRKKSAGSAGGTGGGVFFAGTDGSKAVDLPEVAGGCTGDCGDDFCPGKPAGAGEGVADEGGCPVFEVEGGERTGGDSG